MDKAELIKAAARKRAVVNIEGLGEVSISALTIRQRQELPGRFDDDPAGAVAWMAACALDEFGPDDLDDVANFDPAVLQEITDAVLKLSGISSDEEDEAKND